MPPKRRMRQFLEEDESSCAVEPSEDATQEDSSEGAVQEEPSGLQRKQLQVDEHRIGLPRLPLRTFEEVQLAEEEHLDVLGP